MIIWIPNEKDILVPILARSHIRRHTFESMLWCCADNVFHDRRCCIKTANSRCFVLIFSVIKCDNLNAAQLQFIRLCAAAFRYTLKSSLTIVIKHIYGYLCWMHLKYCTMLSSGLDLPIHNQSSIIHQIYAQKIHHVHIRLGQMSDI